MPDQAQNGAAFEYAVTSSIETELHNWLRISGKPNSTIRVINDERFAGVQTHFFTVSENLQSKMVRAAKAGLSFIFPLEPHLWNGTLQTPVEVRVNANAGGLGDVRDILMFRHMNPDGTLWEIGLSCKWNHEALKHSRLSKRIDFGNDWFNSPCTQAYWDDIQPIMNELETNRGNMWRNYPNKAERIYVPLLEAFMREIRIQSRIANDFPPRLVQYLVGRFDFYKIIAQTRIRRTDIQAFNLHNSLNRRNHNLIPENQINNQDGGMPTRLVEISWLPNSVDTVTMIFDRGWQFTFRIHSAESTIIPSLKFDIRFAGSPFAFFTKAWE